MIPDRTGTMVGFRKPDERSSGEEQRREPNPVDVHVGSRIRIRRKLLGFSQEHLAGLVGLTFQQIQKYERGANRVGASRLLVLSRVLDVPINFFFDDMPANLARTKEGPCRAVAAESQEGSSSDGRLSQGETLELLRAYYLIRNPSVRRRVLDLIKSMGPPG